MENVIESNETSKFDKPWLTIWLKPRKTFQYILNDNPQKGVIVLGMIAGLSRGIDQASDKSLLDLSQPLFIFLLLISPFAGLANLYIMSEVTTWLGKKFGGTANSKIIRSAYAWSGSAHVLIIILYLITFYCYGIEIFSSLKPNFQSNPFPLYIISFFGFIPCGWTIITRILFVKQAHKFSIWKSIITLAIPFAVAIGIGLLFGGWILLTR